MWVGPNSLHDVIISLASERFLMTMGHALTRVSHYEVHMAPPEVAAQIPGHRPMTSLPFPTHISLDPPCRAPTSLSNEWNVNPKVRPQPLLS